jgi:hypothetical protein
VKYEPGETDSAQKKRAYAEIHDRSHEHFERCNWLSQLLMDNESMYDRQNSNTKE